ncbi:MAG: hypothetical protein ACKV2V_00240 [Blastocatellia bacterium]
MRVRPIVSASVLLALLGSFYLHDQHAARAFYAGEMPAAAPEPDKKATAPAPLGIVTSRIPKKFMSRWQAIEQIVFAEDQAGQVLHPTLRSLWEWADTSGHAIYIELIPLSNIASSTAGNFNVERLDPTGERHQASLKIYLGNIDQALVGPGTARADGFIPFAGLSRDERYAEVLGHELGHAADILAELKKTRKVEDLIEQTNQLLLRHHQKRAGPEISADLSRRLGDRDSLLRELESRAETLEQKVWRELIRGRSLKSEDRRQK